MTVKHDGAFILGNAGMTQRLREGRKKGVVLCLLSTAFMSHEK